MTPERWQQIREVFGSAIARAPEERASFVKEVCAGDEDLLREVESLLAAYEQDRSFLEQPAFRVADEIEAVEREVLSAGQVISHYEMISLIGEGGMGEVYLARDERLSRRVALKLLPARFTTDRERLRRFEQEAQAASLLSHPNVCTIHEVGETGEGRHYIVMEYVEGVTLREQIAVERLSMNEMLDIGVQIASALAAAHGAGVVHRDIKPENVIIKRDGLVKVLDFGLAKLTEHQQGVDLEAATRAHVTTRTGLVMGTPHYMSPEQARGRGVDARTDIWSLGCVLYEMVIGRVPFEGETSSHVIISIMERDPPPLAQFTGEVPAELEWIVKKALRKDREERYQTVKEFLSDLKSLKHRLEFEAELERSVQPDAGNMSAAPKSGTPPGGSVSDQLTAQADGERLSGGVGDFQNRIKAHQTVAIFALAALIIATAGFAYAAYLIYRRPQNNQQSQAGRQAAQRPLSRLTFDAGLQSGVTWSPDGRFIAYSSDRGGNFDIWVQPVGGGDAVQVTRSPAQEWQPDWSPDGNRIVFRSEREGGGLFVVPALGGRERRVSAFGYRPRWSPDGTKILFVSSAMMPLNEGIKVYVTGPNGESPRQILTEFLIGFYHLDSVGWHPDGRRVSVWGRQIAEGKFFSIWEEPLSFWTIPLAGGTPIKSELPPDVEKHLTDAAVTFSDFRWAPSGEALYFEGVTMEVINLWKVMVDPQTLQWTAGPERLTTGVGSDTNMALSADGNRLAFTTRTESTRIWSLPFDARTGKVRGDGQPVTATGINAFKAHLSRDGKKLTFTGQRPGTQRQEVWVKSLEDGREILLAADEFDRGVPLFSHDGERLVYNRVLYTNPERTENKALKCLMPAGGGEEQCMSFMGAFKEMLYDWSADGYWLIGSCIKSFSTENRVFLCQFPVSASRGETEVSVVVAHPEYDLWQAHFSPDERWISFIAQKVKEAGVSAIYVMPASGGEWRRVTEEKYWADKPRWSPDGKTIYFLSNQGSAFFNVWGARFDPVKGETVGEPFQVTSFGIPGRMISPRIQDTEIDLSRERLVLPITEVTGSIWMLDNVDR